MSKYFEGTINNLFLEAEEKVLVRLAQVGDEAMEIGVQDSSRQWLKTQQIMLAGISEYSDTLIKVLTRHEPTHSPIRKDDFDLAKRSVEDFSLNCKAIYEQRRQRKAFGEPSKRPQFDETKLLRTTINSTQAIEGERLSFTSKRSLLKSIIYDTKKRILIGISITIVAVLCLAIDYVFDLISLLLES